MKGSCDINSIGSLLLITSLFISNNAVSSNEGMILVRAGQFYMGRDHSSHENERPRHLVKLSSYLIDSTLVTVEAFRQFVKATSYKTTAEKSGYGMVAIEGMSNWEWKKTPMANWRQPAGPQSIKVFPNKDSHPVVSVSWEDANSYCKWAGKRLPTEAEWEYAARAGKSDILFPWGNSPNRENGKFGLNNWQGESHRRNEMKDGYRYTSPVKAFPPNDWGLYDPVGNVWQWVADWYADDYFQKINSTEGASDPQGPRSGRDRVARGGSWWCSSGTCSGFGLVYRGKALPSAVFNNNGFRCAKDLS